MIYVDEVAYYPHTTLRHKEWSHMWSDTSEEELHAMASKIGLKREWFQKKGRPNQTDAWLRYYDHYDVTPPKRTLALRLGAVEINARDYLVKMGLVGSAREGSGGE